MSIFDANPRFTFGELNYPNGGLFGPVNHSYIVIFLVYEGEIVITSDNKQRTVIANEATIVFHKNSLKLDMPEQIQSHVAWCESYDVSISNDKRKIIESLPVKLPLNNNILDIHQLGLKLSQNSTPDSNELINSLGVALFNAYLYESNLIQEERPLPRSILKVKQYINGNYAQTISTEALAEIAALSTSHLIKQFRKFFDMTPQKYVWQLRTEKGAYLLKHSGLTISEISEQCGFKNQYHFSRHIKKLFNVSPSNLRKMNCVQETDKLLEHAPRMNY